MWIKNQETYFNVGKVLSVKVDYSQHSLRLLTVDGDEQILKLPRGMSVDEAHRRLTALLNPCEPFTTDSLAARRMVK